MNNLVISCLRKHVWKATEMFHSVYTFDNDIHGILEAQITKKTSETFAYLNIFLTNGYGTRLQR